MSNTYISFKKYPDAAQAKDVEQLLLDKGIPYLFSDNGASIDTNLGGGFLKDYEIKLQPEDFERAEELLLASANKWTSDVPADYYLLTFTDEELYDVILKKDEWSEFDFLLAQKLLAERGKSINAESLRQLEKQRLQTLAQPDDLHFGWIITGYVTALLGGIFGVMTGYFVYTSKKVLPNGTKVYSYSPDRRAHAKTILILGIIVLVLAGTYRIFANS